MGFREDNDGEAEAAVDLSPSERFAAFLRGLRLGRGERASAAPVAPGNRRFWREFAVTVALLALWWFLSTRVPVPVLDYKVLGEFRESMLGASWADCKTGVGAVGLEPYFMAHALMFWFVMAIPRLRQMGFDYRFSLNRHTVGLTLAVAIYQANMQVNWYANLWGPSGRSAVLPFFQDHPVLFRVTVVSALLGGLLFSLVVLQAIRRWGIPCALTCMVLWESGAGLLQAFPTLKENWYTFVSNLGPGQRDLLRIKVLVGLAVLGALVYLALKKVTARRPEQPSLGLVSRVWNRFALHDPPPFVFGVFSTGFLAVCVDSLVDSATVLASRGRASTVSDAWFLWSHQHFVLAGLLWIGLIIPSALLVYRLVYNPALRHRLQSDLGCESDMKDSARRTRVALALWCGLILAVSDLQLAKDALWNLGGPWLLLGSVSLWDLLLVSFAVVSIRAHYWGEMSGLHAPVLTHGYYEPLLAARTFLQGHGIPSRIWGEPYAFLYGTIVGPIATKHLLVAPPDRDQALELLKGAREDSGKSREFGTA